MRDFEEGVEYAENRRGSESWMDSFARAHGCTVDEVRAASLADNLVSLYSTCGGCGATKGHAGEICYCTRQRYERSRQAGTISPREALQQLAARVESPAEALACLAAKA